MNYIITIEAFKLTCMQHILHGVFVNLLCLVCVVFRLRLLLLLRKTTVAGLRSLATATTVYLV